MTYRPHDALFKAAFEHPDHARGLFLGVLPQAVSAALSWDTLGSEPGSFIDPELADRHSDLLFSVAVADKRALLYLLLEHQSTRDPDMPRRMLSYLDRIWDRHRKQNPGPLPLILPIVVSHAPEGWARPVTFESLLDPSPSTIPGLVEFVPRFSLIIEDLAHLSNDDIKARALAAFPKLALWLLRDARDATRLFDNLSNWVAIFREALQTPHGLEAVALLLRYIAWVCDDLHFHHFREKIREQLPEAEKTTMTIAEQLIEEGRERGLEQGLEQGLERGRHQGRLDLVIKLLATKFGDLPAEYADRLAAASVASLDRYAERIITAKTLAEVFVD